MEPIAYIFITWMILGIIITVMIVQHLRNKNKPSPTFIIEILQQLIQKSNSIILKQNEMNENLAAIKADLIATKDIVTNVAADVQRLHDVINGAGGMPTQAEWDEVKGIAGDLKTSLQAVDDATPE